MLFRSKSTKPDWIAQKKLNLLAQFALKKHRELPDTPLILDFVTDAEGRKAIELMAMSNVPGRPFIAPPGTPPERLEILRKALMATLADPAFLAEAEKRKMEIEPVGGEDLAALMRDAYAMPRAVIDRVKKYMSPEK